MRRRSAGTAGHVPGVMLARFAAFVRWLLVWPSPSLLATGQWGAAERRYVRLRASGRIPEAFVGADLIARHGARWAEPPER